MDILFWSGGKDSYLALQFYRKSNPETALKLLTTFDESNDIVPHQKIAMEDIRKQASSLNMDLIEVPLPADCPNDIYIEKVKVALDNLDEPVDNLVFGDWKLEDIREWREKVFSEMGYHCLFPIWEKDLNELLTELILKPVEIKISSVDEKFSSIIGVGETYDQAFVRQIQLLKENIDPMGENGEFHTRVEFREWEKPEKQPLIP